ncbi:hypothetical protein [Citricoccus muralis]|uniref:DUF4230 domain-containing protein n=1 Tax=Citricoccus muralis TaxID=169134 RepID=A0A3D9LF09_9MICC|nr:hypothetical protein [Citricoccus muralis]REE04244.1 hypothetical protein C8E99_2071 [Citricoccus muralis]
MAELASKRGLLWPIALIVVVIIALGLLAWTGAFAKLLPWSSASESKDTQVITAIERQEEVALLRLGIQGVTEESANFKVNDWQLPGSAKATFIQYTFNAKLGIDGEEVTIEQDGSDTYRVNIPEFIFIGHDDLDFKLITENNGALSWLTPEIEQTEMVNEVLDEDAQQQYLDSNEDILKDQAEDFYRSIIVSVVPEADVQFDFRS